MVVYKKNDGESDLQYIWRVCSAKDAGTLQATWQEVANLLNKELLEDESEYLSESAYRKKYQQAKAFYDEVFSKMTSDEHYNRIANERIEAQKERYKFFDQRNAYNRLLRARSREEELNEIIYDVMKHGNLPTIERPHHREHEHFGDSDMLISLNDIHYGADIANAWNVYNSDVCRERFAIYLAEILKIRQTHNCENAIVWCNGDEISGNIHYEIAVTNKENVIEQIMGVSELIAEFLAYLSEHFKTVRFVSVAGNHSRIDKKEKALKGERLDDLVEWYLKARLADWTNIIFDPSTKIDDTMYMIKVRGLNYVGCHGDYDASAGRGRVLDLQSMIREPVYAVMYGHLHTNRIDSYQGVKMLMSGSFQGVDNYCISKRIIGEPEQLVCVVDENGVRCSYDVSLKTQNT